MTYGPFEKPATTSFGEALHAELTPIIQLEFPYNINSRIVTTRLNQSGTVTQVDQKAELSSGAAINSSAQMVSVIGVKYAPGEGALIRFSALFSTPKTGSSQEIGIGSPSDGYYFQYEDTTFGINRRQGGSEEVRRLSIGTASTTNENITITVDGVDKTDVAVTNTGDATLTANEIAAADFSDVGAGWVTHSMGTNVFFTSYDAAAHSEAYSLSNATSAVGTFFQGLAGVAPTNNRIAQADWNKDTLGAGELNPSGMTLIHTNLNVYQIRYQWLGAGSMFFYVFNPEGGLPLLVHEIEYSNANTVPSIDNPTLPLCVLVKNTTNNTDIVMATASMGGFIEGRVRQLGVGHSQSVTANVGTTETPLLTIHGHDIFQGKINRVRVKLKLLSVSVDGSKPSILRITRNVTLTGSSFSALNSGTSTIHVDTSSTLLTGGEVIFTAGLSKVDSIALNSQDLEIFLEPNEFLTISLQATATTVDTVLSLSWEEIF